MFFRKKGKENRNTVYLNRPIQKKEEDWIGISTYVEKLDDAIEDGAKIIAVTSDFGTGKSSLISLYRNIYENKIKSFIIGKGKKVLSINMWGGYTHIKQANDKNTSEHKIIPLELHKAFIYQVISQIDSKNKRKSNYISRRLSKDFGIFSVNGKNSLWSFISIATIIGFILSIILYKFQDIITNFCDLDKDIFTTIMILLFIFSVIGFGFAIANSEIIFSSKKSEGNRTFDENVLIDLFKQEVMNHCRWQHYVIVIEDLDRIDDWETVLQFLRELRKYYLTEGGKHKISFIVCIKPEAKLQNISQDDDYEYKKIFDYIINLQKINIDNFDTILKGLLEEKRNWLEELSLSPQLSTLGMEWMIHGKRIDIREVKNRLNESLTLYESLLNRFPDNANKTVISFEMCAIATYLRREYENDFYKLEDDALDILVSQYAIRGLDTIEDTQQPSKWDSLTDEFKEDVVRLIKSKKIDANYRLYFYNYPRDSKLFTISEMRVFNSIVYQETPKEQGEYREHLNHTSEKVILEAYQKISTLGVRMPLFVLDYDKLFVLLYNNEELMFWELIESQRFDKNNEDRICNMVEKCVQRKEGEYDWGTLVSGLAQHLNNVIEDKTVLCSIRQKMCKIISNKVILMETLFKGDNPFITSEEVAAINDGNAILDIINYVNLDKDALSVDEIHQKIMEAERWDYKYIEFYLNVIGIQGMKRWKDALSEACSHFGKIPEEIVGLYEKAIKERIIVLDDYVACIENVDDLEKTQLHILNDYQWINGLSKRLCEQMYQAAFYLEYLCNITLLEQVSVPYENENIFDVIVNNADWIYSNAENSFRSIRKSILQNHVMIEKYTFLFIKPYPILSETELLLVEAVEDALKLMSGRNLTDEQAEYLVNYFNQKYRKTTTAYEILCFIMQQEEKIAKTLFYGLNLLNVPYIRMAKSRKKQINDNIYELFQMEKQPEARVQFLSFTGVPIEEIEKGLWEVLNQDENLCKTYVAYVNKLKKIPNYTLRNILKLNTIGIYSPEINQKFWECKEYSIYVSSKTAYENQFIMEEDKLNELWPTYVMLFNSSGRDRTRSYMNKNQMFIRRLIKQKTYLNVGQNIMYYAVGEQSVDLLNYVVDNYDEKIFRLYFSKINGFVGYDAAHRFCELAKDNSIISEDKNVYENIKGKLINPGLEGWFTKIWKRKK